MSYQGGSSSDYGEQMRKLPYKIIPGEESTHNMNIWLERAIVSERIRLAMGLSLRPIGQQVATFEAAAAHASGAIVGSKFVQLLHDAPSIAEAVDQLLAALKA